MINYSHCKLFLEGVNVPFNSIAINETLGQPVTANITIPATEDILKILPKTMAHIFYRQDNKYCLIFEGELSGYSFSRSQDKREIVLFFTGLMNNWLNTTVASVDATFSNLNNAYTYFLSGMSTKDGVVDAPEPKVIKFNFSATFKIISVLSSLIHNITSFPKSSFAQIIKETLFNDLDNSSLYYKHIKRALSIDTTRIYVQDNAKANKYLEAHYVREYLNNQLQGSSYAMSFLQILNKLFAYVAYEVIELGSPIKASNGNMYSMMVKPIGDYMLPIKCNTVFTDQISHMNFNRNFDIEPTRMLHYVNPVQAFNAQYELSKFVLGVIAPTDILQNTKDTNAPVNSRRLGITEEEKYRGIIPMQYQDTTGMDEMYLWYAGEKSAGHAIDDLTKSIAQMATDQGNAEAIIAKHWSTPTEPPLVAQYLLANYDFINARLSSRTFSVSTPYSPYRVTGFAGAVIDRDFPTVIGTISQITSNISSDGNATQTLTFTRARVWWDGIKDDNSNGFLSEYHFHLPGWFDSTTFGAGVVGSKFYKVLNDNVKVKDFSIADVLKDAEKKQTDFKVINDAIKTLKAQYSAQASPDDRGSYADNFIQRPLMGESDVWQFLTNAKPEELKLNDSNPIDAKFYRKASEINASNIDQNKWLKKPFILERRDRINEIFAKQIGTSLPIGIVS